MQDYPAIKGLTVFSSPTLFFIIYEKGLEEEVISKKKSMLVETAHFLMKSLQQTLQLMFQGFHESVCQSHAVSKGKIPDIISMDWPYPHIT